MRSLFLSVLTIAFIAPNITACSKKPVEADAAAPAEVAPGEGTPPAEGTPADDADPTATPAPAAGDEGPCASYATALCKEAEIGRASCRERV